jgi:hypothetical protein
VIPTCVSLERLTYTRRSIGLHGYTIPMYTIQLALPKTVGSRRGCHFTLKTWPKLTFERCEGRSVQHPLVPSAHRLKTTCAIRFALWQFIFRSGPRRFGGGGPTRFWLAPGDNCVAPFFRVFAICISQVDERKKVIAKTGKREKGRGRAEHRFLR